MEFSAEDIKKLGKAIKDSSLYTTQKVTEEDAIVIFGGTRAGKSTLINFLIGNKLEGKKLSAWEPVTLSKVDSDSPGPEIGSEITSETALPTKWTSEKLPGTTIWELPRFDDNKNSILDITNSFYLCQQLKKVKSLKIALVVDVNDILHDNIKPFIDVLDAFENLLGNEMKNCFPSVSIIFTKVPDSLHEVAVNKEFIKRKLTHELDLSIINFRMSDVSEAFVKYLIKNDDQIALFKRAKLGLATSDIAVNIFPAIENLKKIEQNTLKGLNSSLSDAYKVFLFEARKNLFPNDAFYDVQKTVKETCVMMANIVKLPIPEEDYKKVYETLKVIERQLFRVLVHETNFEEKLLILQSVGNEISLTIEKHDLLNNISVMDLIDQFLDIKTRSQFAVKLQTAVLSSASIVTEAVVFAQLRLGEMDKEKHSEFIEKRRLKNLIELETSSADVEKLIIENEKKEKKLNFLMRSV